MYAFAVDLTFFLHFSILARRRRATRGWMEERWRATLPTPIEERIELQRLVRSQNNQVRITFN